VARPSGILGGTELSVTVSMLAECVTLCIEIHASSLCECVLRGRWFWIKTENKEHKREGLPWTGEKKLSDENAA